MKLASAGVFCAILLCLAALAELSSSAVSGPAFLRRRRRQALRWSCGKEFVGCVFEVNCSTNLPIIAVTCTLDGDPYPCDDSLQISVNLTDDDGSVDHTLTILVIARFARGSATLPYYFRFNKRDAQPDLPLPPTPPTRPPTEPATTQVPTTAPTTPPTPSPSRPTTQPPPSPTSSPTTPATPPPPPSTASCTLEQDGTGVVFTCAADEGSPAISLILYSVNRGNQALGSATGFRIRGRTLRIGNNTVSITFVFVNRDTFTQSVIVQRLQPFEVTCRSQQASEIMGESLEITCTSMPGSQQISDITYTVNGGQLQSARSMSDFSIPGEDFSEGNNSVVVVVTAEGGAVNELPPVIIRRLVPQVMCVGSYGEDGGSYRLQCNVNVLPTSADCSLNGAPYECSPGTSLTFRFLPPQERLQVLDLYWWIDFKLILSFDDYTLVICARQWIIYSYYPYGHPETLYCEAQPHYASIQFSCPESVLSQSYSINDGARIISFGSDFTVYDSQLNSGENSVVLITNGASGSTYDIEYDVWKLRAASSPDTSDYFVTCGAEYVSGKDVAITCSKVDEDAPDITAIRYSINGGNTETAATVPTFTITRNELPNEEVNSVSLTVSGGGGVNADTTLELVSPLQLRCTSQTVDCGIAFACTINRPPSNILLQCYLDGTLQESCDLFTLLLFSELDQGRHSYTIVASDEYGFSGSNQLSFTTENSISVSCRGILKLGSSVYSVSCDSDQPLNYSLCLLDGQNVPCPDSLDFDVSTLQPGLRVLELTVQNECGNTVTISFNFIIPAMVGSCDIDTDEFDDIVDWTCTANANGVSIICLVNGVPLEDCICNMNSAIGTAKYPDGDYTLDLILSSPDGRSKNFSHSFTVETLQSLSLSAVEPLEYKCLSQTNNVSVIISVVSNKEVDLNCLLDGIPQDTCGLTNVVNFRDMSQGLHTFTIVAEDKDGLVDKCEVHFEEDLDISCRGAYNPALDVVHLVCDSTRPLVVTECELDDGSTIDCPSPYDVPIQEFVDDLYSLRVEAQDEFGNTDSEELTFMSAPPPSATFYCGPGGC